MSLLRHPGFILVLLILVVLLFGSSKLPDLARGVGQSLKILRKDIKDMRDDGNGSESGAAPASREAREATQANQGSQAAAPEVSSTGPSAADSAPGVALPGSPGQTAPLPAPEPQVQPTAATPDAVEGDENSR